MQTRDRKLRLSAYQFDKYCEENMFKKYTFSTMNQGYNDGYRDLHICNTYDNIDVIYNPNAVILRKTNSDSSDCMTIRRVKHVDITETDVYVKFTIVCGNMRNSDIDKEYVLICNK